jgi:hypothetical protein
MPQNTPIAFISEFSLASLNKCRNDQHNGYVNAWMRPTEQFVIPLYTTAPALTITDDQAERILALVKGEEWRNRVGAGGIGPGKALANALDTILGF